MENIQRNISGKIWRNGTGLHESACFNVDQSPLPFVIDHERTYEIIEAKEKRYNKVWIQQPGSGLDKRQCMLQVCVRAEGEQTKLAIIFRGTGKGIKETEISLPSRRGHLFPKECLGRCVCPIGK